MMCVVETAHGCWSYLCQECQEDSIAKDERIRNLEAALREIEGQLEGHNECCEAVQYAQRIVTRALAGQEVGR